MALPSSGQPSSARPLAWPHASLVLPFHLASALGLRRLLPRRFHSLACSPSSLLLAIRRTWGRSGPVRSLLLPLNSPSQSLSPVRHSPQPRARLLVDPPWDKAWECRAPGDAALPSSLRASGNPRLLHDKRSDTALSAVKCWRSAGHTSLAYFVVSPASEGTGS